MAEKRLSSRNLSSRSAWAGHPPEGSPRGMGPIFLTINRNKRSVLLDLTDPKSRKTLERLIKSSDVFAASVRYAGLKRLGLSYEDVAAMKPVALQSSDVPAKLIETERSVATQKAAEDAEKAKAGVPAAESLPSEE